jgi:ribosomal-protein-alanine N-acetyltransferase
MSTLQIRPAVAADLPRLMGLDHSVTSEYVWQLELRRDAGQLTATFRDVRLPRPISLAYPKDPFSLADEWTQKVQVFVAVNLNEPVGYLCLAGNSSSAVWVTDLVVNAEWRRRGVASALLNAVQEWGPARGYKKLFLEMQSKNHPAIRLAQKHGYEFCGYNDHYYPSQDVALFFVRALK